MYEKIQETVDYLINKGYKSPLFGIVMGTGLGNLSTIIRDQIIIPYTEIPNFPFSTFAGHSGNLIYGAIGDKKVVALQGRFQISHAVRQRRRARLSASLYGMTQESDHDPSSHCVV